MFRRIFFTLLIFLLLHEYSTGESNNLNRLSFEIEEETEVGAFVGRIPTKPNFTYRFNEAVPQFTLHPSTGEIKTAQKIDREILLSPFFDLVILSSQPTYPTEVRINIKDINDNFPIFPESVLKISFSESAKPGTRVFIDTAQDADVGKFSMGSNYKIISGNHDGHFKLVVTESHSEFFLHVETTVQLDREKIPFYKINISASDGGIPFKTGYMTLDIKVIDANDNPPIFEYSDYSVTLNESVSSGTEILTVFAKDADEGDNGKIVYYLSESESQFSINSETGTISTVENSLNCQKECEQSHVSTCPKSCILTVFARDLGVPRQDGRTIVTVNLLDTNDHSPVITFRYFPETSPIATVDENAANGSVVAAVIINDPDEGPNGETDIRILSGNELEHFELEPTSDSLFLLRVSGVLDREKVGKYNLSMRISDRGIPMRTSYSFLLVQVNDVNDHEPIFEKTEYFCTLSEGVPIGSYVESIVAHDEDSGINAQVFYSIAGGNENDWFSIEPTSGLLTTKSFLDREVNESVVLKISARDGGPSPKWAYTQIRINLLDENDQVPNFSKNETLLKINEELAPGTVIGTFLATDLDQGTNGSVSYYINSDNLNYFYIDPQSTQLQTKIKLDREKKSEYSIEISAVDKGSPPLSSTMTLNLILNDINDNIPSIYPLTYIIPPPYETFSVNGSDLDQSSKLFYFISSSSMSSSLFSKYFTLNSSTGQIKKISESVRELHYFFVQIKVRDDGGKECEKSAVLHFVRNREEVKFSANSYSFEIEENSYDENREIGGVKLAKSDGLKIEISEGDPMGIFSIDGRGKIFLNKEADREEAENYNLTVLALGKFGNNLVYGKTYVNIKISDVNDNAPVFIKNPSQIEIYENAPLGHELIKIIAVDSDLGLNGTITYTLSENYQNVFSISSSSGIITLQKPLYEIFDTTQNIILKIKAEDRGSPKSLSSFFTLKVKIADVNNFSPVFNFSSYETFISESAPINTIFFNILATDADLDLNGAINYKITNGNEEGKFGIFPDGALYLKNDLDREKLDYYFLTIVATDYGTPSRSSSASLTVQILDENDSPPIFSNSTFTFFLSENDEIDAFVGKILATDEDEGRNSQLFYSIANNSLSAKDFKIEPTSGIIKSLKSFDRESQNLLTFDVIVSDGGRDKKLSDGATVRVYIEDENDNKPIFSKNFYFGTVSESAPIGAQVLRVLATDLDEGLNGEIVYSLLFKNENDKNMFKVDQMSGQIFVNGPLDRESVENYEFIIIAVDLGTPSLNSTSSVKIQILDENDNEPLFVENSSNFISISETAEINSELFQFHATDSDLGVNREITLEITGGNRHDIFRLDSQSGKLYLSKNVDFEKFSSYSLNITATDSGSPKLSTSIQFTVKIEDANDNAPSFPPTAIVRQIVEGIPINSSIVTISAEDPDSGLFGKIQYSIVDQEPPGANFRIHPEFGTIFTTSEIDREFTDSFKLRVRATDSALPVSSRLFSEKLVTIIIDDVNDNAPEFLNYNAAFISKNSREGAEIMQLIAQDKDSDSNGAVTYELLSGDSSLFKIDRNSGLITLRKNLIDIQPRYQLNIRAADEASQGLRKYTDFTLTLIGVDKNGQNRNRLKFSEENYKGYVYENEEIETSVIGVKTNGENGGEVEFYITNIRGSKGGENLSRIFEIDGRSGLVTTNNVFDRESGTSEFDIQITAIWVSGTKGIYTSSANLRVEVLDRNDEAPKFKDLKKEIEVPENFEPGSILTDFIAKDPDSVGKIYYSLLKGDPTLFKVNSELGNLKLLSPLDRESTNSYHLVIQASDGTQSSNLDLFLKVTDINDNAPQFKNGGIYSFDIWENSTVGTIVGALNGTDPDSGPNGKITYSIVSEEAHEIFNVGPESGLVTLTSLLDYEKVQHYILKIRGEDSGTPSLFSIGTLYLNIIDLNDNPPVFDSFSNTNWEIFENIPIGSSILSLKATDADSGANAQISYSISSGNENGDFKILENGTIVTEKELDREKKSNYLLTVVATDGGFPNQLSASTQVSLVLKDINDESPVFISPNKTGISEGSRVGTLVFGIKAVDKDEGRNSYVEYLLNNEKHIFTLGPIDGLLRLNSPLDREERQNYTLNIIARDKGDPSQSSSQQLFIQVLDENDNSPIFVSKSYSASILENVSIGATILNLEATDRDEGLNGEIRYFIESGDENMDFSIGTESGVLRTRKNLDFERKERYNLTIRAEDSGEKPRSDSCSIFIQIINVNDNPPIFPHSPHSLLIRENYLNLSSPIFKLNGVDADTNNNSVMRYLIKDPHLAPFRINSTSGEIYLTKELDREEKSEYLISVVAMDTGSPRLSSSGLIKVKIVDTNDNIPIFDNLNYDVSIDENSPVGSRVLSVHANDADEGLNAQIRYAFNGSGIFSINVESGEVVTSEIIPKNGPLFYTCLLKATDSNPIVQNTGTSQLTIRVKRNISILRELKDPQNVTVTIPSQSQIGTFVYGSQIKSNFKIKYFLSGPDADKFQIDENSGIVKTLKSLNSSPLSIEIHSTETLKFQKEPFNQITYLQVLLAPLSKFPKLLSAPSLFFTFPENTKNLNLTTVKSPLAKFSIGAGNSKGIFILNETSGDLKIGPQGLDYEATKNHEIYVLATISNFSSPVLITINVTDVNDNSPIFEKSTYEFNVPEEEYGPIKIGQIKATDIDSDINGEITYDLYTESKKAFGSIFNIEKSTGVIFLNSKLDREEKDIYSLKIIAFDSGTPTLNETCVVNIKVDDKNDNPPRFSRLFNVNITENSPSGSFVTQVTTIDKDVGKNAQCSYSFTEESQNSKFSIDSQSGNITVIGNLDREEIDEYGLKVVAIDGAWRAETLVTISVQDQNDNYPIFDTKTYVFNIVEKNPPHTKIGTVFATDKDKKGPNSQISYALKSPNEFFTIEPQTGVIFSKKSFEHKKKKGKVHNGENEFKIIVVGQDGGKPGLSTEVDVIVNVLDSKNSVPKFEQTSYFSAVPQEFQIAEKILTLKTIQDEEDSGPNAVVEYSVESGNGTGLFSIHPQSGSLYVTGDLGGKIWQQFHLKIRATDKGLPPLSSTTDLNLFISGPNTHEPTFSSLSYRVIVPENEQIGTPIVTLSASDEDKGLNGKIKYSIYSGNEAQFFNIDSSSGTLTINKKLDFDTTSEYQLSIEAADCGFETKKSYAELTVHLTDINDNAPIFNSSIYTGSVFENAPMGTPVINLIATDKDSPKFSEIVYGISGGSGRSYFSINSTSGLVTTKKIFDFEEKSEYSLEIIASNPDSSLFSTTELRITILGQNEFFPIFKQSVYHFTVSEFARIGSIIGKIEATDEDNGPDGIIQYLILPQGVERDFSIESKTGEIRLVRSLQKSNMTKFIVMAKNPGPIRGGDFDEARIIISVQEGVNPPIFSQNVYIVSISENSPKGTIVTQVRAELGESEDKLGKKKLKRNKFRYEILEGNYNDTFNIDPDSGSISLFKKLNYKEVSEFVLKIGAVDSNEPPQVGTSTVVIQIEEAEEELIDNEDIILNGESSAPDPLSIGLTLVVIFFIILLVAILVSFIVFRMRKGEKSPIPPNMSLPHNKHNISTSHSSNPQNVSDIVRNSHLSPSAPKINSRKILSDMSGLGMSYHKPDIIERSPAVPTHSICTPPEPHLRSSKITENNMRSSNIYLEPDSEHENYDIDNGSSIGASDIDIVYHYKNYKAPPPNSSSFAHAHFGSSSGLKSKNKTTPLARCSPSSEMSQQTGPRILTLQDISGKPFQNVLLQNDGMSVTQSERSNSQSSAMSSVVKSHKNKKNDLPSVGLTAEEVERLNSSRHKNNSSLVSTLDDVSSSGSGARKKKTKKKRESSEEEGSENDSFSCSEFEYGGKKINNFRGAPPFKNNVENGSLSTLVASDDELGFMNGFRKKKEEKKMNGGESWSYLNNWGAPNYSPRSNMFKERGEISNNLNGRSNGRGAAMRPGEEYV